VSTARLFLSGIRAEGRHGARPGEKDEPQPFVVDLDLQIDVGQDRIEETIDYRTIADLVRGIVREGSFDLIEAMAEQIAHACLELPRVMRVTASVRKPNAAARLKIDGVVAAVTMPEA
jgi:dihydroneopterin aldolase